MFLAKKTPRRYIGLHQKFFYKSSHYYWPPPKKQLFSHLPWCNKECVWSKEYSVMWFSISCTRLQWSVRIYQMRCQWSDWTIYVWHINIKWHIAAFHTNLFSYLPQPFLVRPSILTRGLRVAVVREDITPEGLFDKEPAPPPHEIQISTSPPSALGDPIEAGFSTPPIGQKTFTLSGIRGWRSMMTCN